jgi:hypothetical protein
MGNARYLRRFQLILSTFAPLLGLAGLLTIPPEATAQTPLEYEVKAAFLLNFARFVEWPSTAFATPQSPLEICILGKDPFGHSLDDVVQGEAVNGRKILVRRLSEPPASQSCQVLFIDPLVKDQRKVLSELPPTVLTVGDGGQFINDGGMIALVVVNGRVRFDINQTAADNSALKLSSKLLSVARSVSK